jgi:hypothetical protein
MINLLEAAEAARGVERFENLRAAVIAAKKVSYEFKYSPDQPRDYHGRFGSGGSAAAEDATLTAALERESANRLDAHPKPVTTMENGLTVTTTPQSANPAVRALQTYQGAGSDAMNMRLREGFQASVADGRETDAEIKAIDSLMRPLETARTLFRAIGDGGLEALLPDLIHTFPERGEFDDVNRPSQQVINDALSKLVGTVITDKGFVSTTSDIEVADAKVALGEMVVQMDVPAGTKAIDIVARDLGDHDYDFEQEVLLARGGSYRIDGVSSEPSSRFARLEGESPVYVIHMTAVKHG